MVTVQFITEMFFIFIPTVTEQILCVVIMIAKEDVQSKKMTVLYQRKICVCACVHVNVCVYECVCVPSLLDLYFPCRSWRRLRFHGDFPAFQTAALQ